MSHEEQKQAVQSFLKRKKMRSVSTIASEYIILPDVTSLEGSTLRDLLSMGVTGVVVTRDHNGDKCLGLRV